MDWEALSWPRQQEETVSRGKSEREQTLDLLGDTEVL